MISTKPDLTFLEISDEKKMQEALNEISAARMRLVQLERLKWLRKGMRLN